MATPQSFEAPSAGLVRLVVAGAGERGARGGIRVAATAPRLDGVGWFCPVVWFWFPCRIVVDIYRASVPPRSAGERIVLRWWAAQILTIVLGLVASLTDLDEVAPAVDAVGAIVVVWTAIVIIQRVGAGQRSAMRQAGGESVR